MIGHLGPVRAAVAALVVFLVKPADALLIRLEDGTRAPGCGLTCPAHQRLARTATRISTEHDHVSPEGWFRVHYDLTPSKSGAVDPTDRDLNRVPDWVDDVAHVADSVLGAYRQLGYTNSLDDHGLGGGDEYDLYILELSLQQAYGYTWPAPNGYMQIDDDYGERLYETHGAEGLRVTLAHELFHALQFTYIGGSDAIWWQEATAVFMEDVLYPDINDYWQYLDPNLFSQRHTFFEDPSLPLDYRPSSTDAHMYGAAVFCHFLDQSDPEHGHDAVRYSFERQRLLRSAGTPVIVESVEDKMGRAMRELLADFWVWCYFTGSRAIPGRFFADAAGYSYPPPNGVPGSEWIVQNLSERQHVEGAADVSHLGGWIVRFPPDGSKGGFRLRLSPSGAGSDSWAWRVAVVAGDSVAVYTPQEGRMTVGGWDAMSDVVLVAANGSTTNDGYEFTYVTDYDAALVRPAPEPFVVTLHQNRPNPFNPATVIPFYLSASAQVSIAVYDAAGRRIRTLLDAPGVAPGETSVEWDGTTDSGRRAGPGVYVVRLSADGVTRARRMVLLR